MSRVQLTDRSGRWFDDKSAIKFAESTYWDGRNHVSKETGSQWEHEAVYRTAGGRWILNQWSQWQGTSETYEEISETDALTWLVRNGHDSRDLPAEIAALLDEMIKIAEL